jgi:hypothetical protein
MNVKILVIITWFFSCLCCKSKTGSPDDLGFTLTITYYPTVAGSMNQFSVNNKLVTTQNTSEVSNLMPATYQRPLTASEEAAFYSFLESKNLQRFANSYSNPDVLDGFRAEIYLMDKNGSEKTIRIENYPFQELYDLQIEIDKLIKVDKFKRHRLN